MGEVSIDDLAARLAEARKNEQDARAARIEAEEAILAQFELGDSERKTVKTGNGLKLTLQTGLTYKLAKGELPDWLPIKETVKRELDVKAYENIRETNPETAKQIAEFVTTTPKKPSVTLAVL